MRVPTILVEECKIMWKSLKDSLRYHKARAKHPKSGSPAEVDDENEVAVDEEVDWEFTENLSFYISASSENKRR